MRTAVKSKSAPVLSTEECRFVEPEFKFANGAGLVSVDEKVRARVPSPSTSRRSIPRPRPAHITSSLVRVMPSGDMFLISDGGVHVQDRKHHAAAYSPPTMHHESYAYNDIYEQDPPPIEDDIRTQTMSSARPAWISRPLQRPFNPQSISPQPQLAPSGASIRSILTSTSYSSMHSVRTRRGKGEARSVKFCETPVIHAGRARYVNDDDDDVSPGGSSSSGAETEAAYDSDDSAFPIMSRGRATKVRKKSCSHKSRPHQLSKSHSVSKSPSPEKKTKPNLFTRAAQWVRKKFQSKKPKSVPNHQDSDASSVLSTTPPISRPYPLSHGAEYIRERKNSQFKPSTGFKGLWIRVTCS